MIAFPNSKINLGLRVLRRRIDGYHDIETVFYPVQWRDALELIESEKYKIAQSGLQIKVEDKNNLCTKAWQMMNEKFDIKPVHIHLHKVIPFGAGLGGGSSDAAYTIKLINDIFELNLKEQELEELASETGSDCAFFIRNKPVIARGRGSEFNEIEIDLRDFKIMVVKPGVNISTEEAYSKIIPEENYDVEEVIKLNPEYWKDKLINDFEKPVFELYPEIKEIKNKLYKAGAVYASMSGSGSAVYGLFYNDLMKVTPEFKNCDVWIGDL